jgi:Bacterial nucleoid DNA-binding protein
MNKGQLIDQVYQRVKNFQINKAQVKTVVNTVFDEIAKALEDNKKVQIHGFGTFQVTNRKGREGINPALYQELRAQGISHEIAKEQSKLTIQSSRNIWFKAAEHLKSLI